MTITVGFGVEPWLSHTIRRWLYLDTALDRLRVFLTFPWAAVMNSNEALESKGELSLRIVRWFAVLALVVVALTMLLLVGP